MFRQRGCIGYCEQQTETWVVKTSRTMIVLFYLNRQLKVVVARNCAKTVRLLAIWISLRRSKYSLLNLSSSQTLSNLKTLSGFKIELDSGT